MTTAMAMAMGTVEMATAMAMAMGTVEMATAMATTIAMCYSFSTFKMLRFL